MSGGPVEAEVTRAGSSPKCDYSISEETEMYIWWIRRGVELERNS